MVLCTLEYDKKFEKYDKKFEINNTHTVLNNYLPIIGVCIHFRAFYSSKLLISELCAAPYWIFCLVDITPKHHF